MSDPLEALERITAGIARAGDLAVVRAALEKAAEIEVEAQRLVDTYGDLSVPPAFRGLAAALAAQPVPPACPPAGEPMSADRLRAIREAATPGPWEVDATDNSLDVRGAEHATATIWIHLAGPMTMGDDADPGVQVRALADARLIALAPDLAEWAADAADYIERDVVASAAIPERTALLARLADLVPDQDGRL